MGSASVGWRGVTILPVVIAILFMLLFSMLSMAMIARGFLSGIEASKREAEEHQLKMKQWVKTYIYNVSLCGTLNLVVKGLRGQPVSRQELDVKGPVKVLVVNEGGEAVNLEHITVEALGSIVYEAELNVRLPPGGWVMYAPRELNLPDDYDTLREVLDMIILFGGRETFNVTVFQPPPLTYVEVGEADECYEP
jgi:hypothetical protein